MSNLRLSYERAYSSSKEEPLPANANGALVFYNKRRDEDILCSFVNALGRELGEVLIRQDDLLKKTVETVLTQINLRGRTRSYQKSFCHTKS